ncbi:hypothetical protein RJ639_002840 [Escallonia herrerae]|uniref:Retrotransposon Copia-like N-terminal domain-containing protein n=1 Tax=Escallonia herrerae TaxID=1293975 RepID=A0AA88W344_9ASTE|nr:hypothetical protein RJ639_002840 [Escallonia herrerae]
MTGAWRSLDSSETTSSTLGGTLRPTMAHGGDHLSQLSFQLTSHKLTRKNYLEWAQSMKLAIDGRGKLGHLTGDVRQPATGDPSLSVWRPENSLIIVWLINSMEPTIGKPYLFLPTAKDVWEAIRLRFLKKKPLPSLREAFSEIRREEIRRKVMLTNPNPKPTVDVENSVLVVKGNEYGNKKIKIADGSLSLIAGTGSIVLSPSIILHDVLHVPKLSCNLLSISKLTNDLKCQANFYSSRCEFQEMVPKRMIGSVRASGGLYFFEDGTNSGKHVQSLSHDIDGNENGGTTGTKELLVYSRRNKFKEMRPMLHSTVKILYHRPFRTPLSLQMEQLKQRLASEFEIKDLGSLKFFSQNGDNSIKERHCSVTKKLGDNKGIQ